METVKRVGLRLHGIQVKPWWFCLAAALMLIVTIDEAWANESQTFCVRYVSDVQFTEAAKGPNRATVDGGKGLTFELSPANRERNTPGPDIGRRMLTALDKGRKVGGLPESFYVSSRCVEKSPTTYWVVEEYTGGMHCCDRYHFFSKSGSDGPIRYLGATDGTMNPLENPWVCKGKDLYFEDSDIRFVYFHIDYVSSRLYIPRFYRLTPSSVAVSNRPFKHAYCDEIAEVNSEIDEKARAKKARPRAIISGNEDGRFTDELGQLLVQKTVLHLFARESQKGWGTFLKDVKSHYETTEGVALLQREIEKIMKEGPY
jgi:hypothetical protein